METTNASAKAFFSVKVPGGYIRSICDTTGTIEVTKAVQNAEWYSEQVGHAIARFARSMLPASDRFAVYSFKSFSHA